MNYLERLMQGEKVEWRELREVTHSLRTGLNPRRNFKLNTSDAKNYYVTVKEITSGKIIFSDKTDRINDDALNTIQQRSNLEMNDVLFSGIGTIGKVALVDIPVDNWNCSESVFLIKPKQESISSKFLMYVLDSNIIKNQYNNLTVGSTLKGIRMGTLSKLSIPIPSLPIQKEIVRILDTFMELTEALKIELTARQKQYEYYRDMLLNFSDIERGGGKTLSLK